MATICTEGRCNTSSNDTMRGRTPNTIVSAVNRRVIERKTGVMLLLLLHWLSHDSSKLRGAHGNRTVIVSRRAEYGGCVRALRRLSAFYYALRVRPEQRCIMAATV